MNHSAARLETQRGRPEHASSPFLPGPPRVGRGLVLTCAAAAALCGAWAFWPLPAHTAESPVLAAAEPEVAPVQLALAPLDLDAFRAPLWVAPPLPPPPPAPAPATPPPPPLKLQLLAVVHEGGVYKAALYDPDTDRIIIAGPGDTIAGRTVQEVRAGDVTLTGHGSVRTLSLRPEGGGP